MTTLLSRARSITDIVGAPTAAHHAATPSGCEQHPTTDEENEACRVDFRHFLNHWWFKNRETGIPQTFRELWPGQENIVQVMRDHPWCFFLKAGKLGFTELECAYDGWVATFYGQNARVHLFSLDATAAKELLKIVKFGLTHLPVWMSKPIERAEPGGDTTTQLTLYGGPDDHRVIKSYAATKDAAIDQSAQHSHVDELARMPWPADTWASVESTVPEGGTVHIVTRGAGEGNYTAKLWAIAKQGGSPLHAHFEPFDSRPRRPSKPVEEGVDPTEAWYAEREAGMTREQLDWLAPRTEEDALRGSGEGAAFTDAMWQSCYDPGMPALMPDPQGPALVISLDAGVTNDLFAAVVISRHPEHPPYRDPMSGAIVPCSRTLDDPAVRVVKVWAVDPNLGQIDYDAVETWLRMMCLGGCVNMHPNPTMVTFSAVPGCEACAQNLRIPRHNVVQVAFDAYQLVNMAQTLNREDVVWAEAFGQGEPRMQADANLRQLVIKRQLAHNGDEVLRQHAKNANAKVSPGEDTKLRFIKRDEASKIDALVATSMGVARCLYLSL